MTFAYDSLKTCTSPRFTVPGESFAVEFVRHKTFWMRIFARTTFLLLKCCSIHVKLCVLATYSARNWVQKSWLRQQCTAVSPLAVAQLVTPKKTQKNWARRIYNSATPYGQAESLQKAGSSGTVCQLLDEQGSNFSTFWCHIYSDRVNHIQNLSRRERLVKQSRVYLIIGVSHGCKRLYFKRYNLESFSSIADILSDGFSFCGR